MGVVPWQDDTYCFSGVQCIPFIDKFIPLRVGFEPTREDPI